MPISDSTVNYTKFMEDGIDELVNKKVKAPLTQGNIESAANSRTSSSFFRAFVNTLSHPNEPVSDIKFNK